jgi:hypothetical protein
MKFILLTLTIITLLSSTGCIFRGDRAHADNQGRLADEHQGPTGVDHGEHPSDLDHGETQ